MVPVPVPNSALNMNLGLPLSSTGSTFKNIRWVCQYLSLVFEYTLETPIFVLWKLIPLSVRASLCSFGWFSFLFVHRLLLGRRTALHPSVSYEAAALSTMMWGARLVPMTLGRMRFSLNQIECNYPPSSLVRKEVINALQDGGKVSGIWIHSQRGPDGTPSSVSSADRRVLVWFYGGAFLSGDVSGNVGLAEKIGLLSNHDVFLLHYSLCPEHTIHDAFRDATVGYKWLLESSGRIPGGNGRLHVSTLGISSGGGVALHVCQSFSGKQAPNKQVLVCPWVHYDWLDLYPSMELNAAHDLVVTQSVNEYVKRLTKVMAGGEEHRTSISPLGKSVKFDGTRTLVVASEHEVTFDETAALVIKIKEVGGHVELYSKPFLPHVFCLISFLPEAVESQHKMAEFLKTN